MRSPNMTLGIKSPLRLTLGDDVIPRSWTMPYTASAFCFEKLFSLRAK